MFSQSIDEVLYPPSKDKFGIQLHQYIKAKISSPLKSVLHLRKKNSLDKTKHLQNLLAWSCNSVSTKESCKATTPSQNQSPNDDNTISGTSPVKQLELAISTRRLDGGAEFKVKRFQHHSHSKNVSVSKCEKDKVEKVCRGTLRGFRLTLHSEPKAQEKEYEPSIIEPIAYQSNKLLEPVYEKHEQPSTKYAAHTVVNRIAKKSSVLPNLDKKTSSSPTKWQPDNGRRLSPSVTVVNPQPSIPKVKKLRGYLQYDEDCFSLFKNCMALATGRRYEICKMLDLSHLSAERICVIDSENLQLILTKPIAKSDQPIQIASLTKILTAFLTILICAKFGVDMKTYRCRVSEQAAFMIGTSAELQVGDTLTIQNLLYGLMLPSGNDASVALAENMGRIILRNRKTPTRLSPYKIFVSHMNVLYRQVIGDSERLKPNLTTEESEEQQPSHLFQNPSGLSVYKNITKPEQITLLAAIAYQNKTFRQIVSKRQYEVIVKNDRYGLQRKLTWKNTNKLLWKGWQGIKTGNTENAGPCLIGKMGRFIVGVFNCASQQKKFIQATTVVEILNQTVG